MAAVNTDPIFSKVGSVATVGTTMGVAVLTQQQDYTGINSTLVWTADATNGGFIQRIRFKALGTNIATVARIFLNNGSSPGTAANNQFYGEVSLPATTQINTAATIDLDYPMNFALDPTFRIYWQLALTVSAGWIATGIGGKY